MFSQIPCRNCPCIPICRNKKFIDVLTECSLVKEYIPNFSDFKGRDQKRLKEIRDTLKPTKWTISKDPEELRVLYGELKPLKQDVIEKVLRYNLYYIVVWKPNEQ